MQMENKNQKISDYFQCPICYQTFNSANRFPRVLICGHTLCEKCIYDIIDKNQNFKCPICKTNLRELRIGLTYRNYSLMNLLQINDIKSKESQSGELTFIISKQTFEQIVLEMEKAPKHITHLIVKRLRDQKNNAFDNDLVRSNKFSMRFYKLLVKFYRLKNFEFWVKFSAHGFEQCLAQSLNELQKLSRVKIVNAYDEYKRMHDLIPLVSNPNIKFEIEIRQWQN